MGKRRALPTSPLKLEHATVGVYHPRISTAYFLNIAQPKCLLNQKVCPIGFLSHTSANIPVYHCFLQYICSNINRSQCWSTLMQQFKLSLLNQSCNNDITLQHCEMTLEIVFAFDTTFTFIIPFVHLLT
jgi:hypothetical protein